MSLHSPTIINPFMIATMNPLAWYFNITRLGHRAEGSTMGELATMAVPTTNTKRRTVHCSKHAFAPIASFHPKNAVAPNVTLPVQRHQSTLGRAGLASESLVTGDDPLNATDPLGQSCDSTNAKKQAECLANNRAVLKRIDRNNNPHINCGPKYYSSGICKGHPQYDYSKGPSTPLKIIEVVGGLIACIPGAAACVAGALVITATNVGSDIESHCSAGDTAVDGLVGVVGAGVGGLSALGAQAVEGAGSAAKAIYSGTTNAGSVIPPASGCS